MGFLDSIIGIPAYIFAILGSLLSFSKVIIDNWKSTELEKIMMSNFKRFQIFLSKCLLIVITFSLLFFLLLINQLDFKSSNYSNADILLVVMLITLISTLIVYMLMDIFVNLLFNVFSFKFNYYIVDEQEEILFRVIKLSEKDCLLVEKDGVEEFVFDIKRKRYKKIRENNRKIIRIYESTKMPKILILLSIVILIVLVGVFLTNSYLWLQFALYITFLLLLIIFLSLLFNFMLYKKDKRNGSSQT